MMENVVILIALMMSLFLPLFVPEMAVKIHEKKSEASLNNTVDQPVSDEPLMNS